MDYDLQHLRNLGLTDRQIELVFETAAKEAAKLAMKVSEFNPERAFDFSDYPETRKLIAEQIRKLGRNIEAVITNSTSMAWLLANNKNNYLCDLVFGENKDSLTESQMKKYYSNNSEALKAFQTRKTAGMNLSDGCGICRSSSGRRWNRALTRLYGKRLRIRLNRNWLSASARGSRRQTWRRI